MTEKKGIQERRMTRNQGWVMLAYNFEKPTFEQYRIVAIAAVIWAETLVKPH